MKKLLLAVLFVFMMVGVVSADDIFTDRDVESIKYTKAFVDDLCATLAESERPCLSTGARSVPDKDIGMMFWVETRDGFFYYEMKIRTINGDKELSNKYNIVNVEDK